jgi:hypothetical protein
MSHTIRLRGFWEVVEAGEHATHSRNFGKPRLPDETEHIWLVCSTLPAGTEVHLNGSLIATTAVSGPFEADITTRLLRRNTVCFTSPRSEYPGEVAMEIRRPS